ncbi:hypothetical protein CYMTET_18658 [Cymbomonas tetramitiformis]|uniref:Core-binding (CB) domain-containing protein n=1 Tax=Cymbomonas tetramitiformis TaxID=36881 RepID=A0AAE0G7Q4_9CHLO|nr:hypothetical protein CYMTET_18658 [Cymbomonas tetramitiformis]
MVDFMVITKTQDDAFVQRDRVSNFLPRLGLFRNEKKGHWEPTQLVEHLGLEVDFEEGLFRVTERRLKKIHSKATAILCRATREQRWVQARELAGFNGLCQPVYMAVPTARLYLRELYFVLGKQSSWGSKVKLTRQAWGDVQWWAKLPATSRWNGRKIWRSPTRAKLHTDSSLFAWGGVLNLKKEGRGFWNDELQKLHITHLELEAVYKTVRSFLSELEGKVVRLYCDNQAVVAMLSHFTSRNPELMRRMRKLWLLLDLHVIELQARYIRSEANEWADRLSRDKDLDDWRINKRWFKYAEEQWGEHSVDRFASEISAQLSRYYSAWHDPGCEGVDSLAYDWRGEHNWVNPPWSLLDEVAHKLREEGAAATVVAPYWPGQSWFRELEALAAEVVIVPRRRDLFTREGQIDDEINKPEEEVRPGCKIEVFWPEDQAWYPGMMGATGEDGKTKIEYDDGDVENVVLKEEKYRVFPSENEEEQPQQRATATPCKTALLRHWTEKLGDNQHSGTAAEMQAAALEKSTADNYERHWKKFVKFCTQENLQWLPATAATVQLYMAALQSQGPATGRAVTRVVKGMTAMQTAAAEQQNGTETVRTYFPASAVRPQTGAAMLRASLLRDNNELSIVLEKEKGKNRLLCKRRLRILRGGVAELHELLDRWEQTRDEDWLQAASTSTARAADTASYWRLPCDKKKQFKTVDANEWIACTLGHVGCVPPEGGHYKAHCTRKGATTWSRAEGVVMEKVCFFGGWVQLSSAVHAYIDPTAVADADMVYYFGWLTPGWQQIAIPMEKESAGTNL